MTNPLLQDWDTPFELAPFDKISDSNFEPALDEALTTHRMEIDAIASCDVAPTFGNTIEALEEAGSQLDHRGGRRQQSASRRIAAQVFPASGGAFFRDIKQQGIVRPCGRGVGQARQL